MPGIVAASSVIASSRSPVSTEILSIPVPGQVAVFASTITQAPLGVSGEAASVTL